MQTTLLLLPALAAFCYGAALLQSIVTGTTISAPAGEPTFTFVIPCFPLETGCVPRTVTIEGRDTPEPTFGFGIPSESVAFGGGVTETALILPRQSLVTGTTISVPQETFTFVIPCYSGGKACVPRTVTLEGRDPEPQSLGSVSRSASIPPTLPTTTSTTTLKTHHHWEPRQSLGNPSRSVPVWPYSTVTITATVTVTATATPPSSTSTTPSTTSTSSTSTTSIIKTLPPTTLITTSSDSSVSRSVATDQGSSSTYSINTSASSAALTARQVLGSPTRTVLEWPHPTVTVTTTIYVTVPPPTSPTSPPSVTSPPSSSPISDETTGTGTAVTTSLPVLTVPAPKDKRQVLGKPTRSVIFY